MNQPPAGLTIHGLPQIRTFAQLASQINVDPKYLWLMLSGPEHWYTCFQVPKKTGGRRNISHPKPALKAAQHWILRNILNNLKVTTSSYGFERHSKL